MSCNSTVSWSLDSVPTWTSGGKGHVIDLPGGPDGSLLGGQLVGGVCHLTSCGPGGSTCLGSCPCLLSFLFVSLAPILFFFF